MGLTSLIAVVAAVASVVHGVPLTLQERQAPSGVPDYVLKYGKHYLVLQGREEAF